MCFRFKDVVPYDENRVKILSDKDNKFGYVNASHISATVGESQRFYIAAQGPMANTVHNFWSMVQECDVHLIVMLTEVSGANKVQVNKQRKVSEGLCSSLRGFSMHSLLATE